MSGRKKKKKREDGRTGRVVRYSPAAIWRERRGRKQKRVWAKVRAQRRVQVRTHKGLLDDRPCVHQKSLEAKLNRQEWTPPPPPPPPKSVGWDRFACLSQNEFLVSTAPSRRPHLLPSIMPFVLWFFFIFLVPIFLKNRTPSDCCDSPAPFRYSVDSKWISPAPWTIVRFETQWTFVFF